MNSKFAWHDLTRQGLPKRSVTQRAADFLEIYGLYDEATAREQATRCIQCPNPSCVTGCPLCNPIPGWLQLTAEGRFLEAAALLGSATNMAEICSRLCPSDHLCEGACLLEAISEPVSIRALEQFVIEYAFAHSQVSTATAPPNGFSVAVLGSGPGGLACAGDLARQGYAVTVLDTGLVPGGLLVNGVAAFKLDHSIVERRIDLLRKCGVTFRLGLKFWEDLDLSALRDEFHAVFLGLDWRKARPLDVPGAELQGVIQAVPFLLQKKSPLPLELPHFEVAGKRVLVLGAGDTAMDCLRAAIRCGAGEAVCVYRREESEMPCCHDEYRNAVEEGARFAFRANSVAVLGDDTGRVTGLRAIRTEAGPLDADGRQTLRIRPGTEFVLEADCVVVALGFEALSCPQTPPFSEFTRNGWGGIALDNNRMTSIPGVFAGGDLVQGPSTVLHVVRDARLAAQAIHTYLTARR